MSGGSTGGQRIRVLPQILFKLNRRRDGEEHVELSKDARFVPPTEDESSHDKRKAAKPNPAQQFVVNQCSPEPLGWKQMQETDSAEATARILARSCEPKMEIPDE
jgi:hypothetical protein